MYEYCRVVESIPRIDLYAPGGVHKEFPKSRDKDALTEILNGLGAKRWEIVTMSDASARITILLKRDKSSAGTTEE